MDWFLYDNGLRHERVNRSSHLFYAFIKNRNSENLRKIHQKSSKLRPGTYCRKESLTDFLPWVLWNCSNKDDNSFFHATVWSFFNTWETIYISFHNNIQNDDSALILAKLWIENKISST